MLQSRVCEKEREKNEKLKKNYYFRRKNRDRTSARVRTLRVLATADWRATSDECDRVRGVSVLRGRDDDEINDNDHTRLRLLGRCRAAESRWCPPPTSRLLPSIILLSLAVVVVVVVPVYHSIQLPLSTGSTPPAVYDESITAAQWPYNRSLRVNKPERRLGYRRQTFINNIIITDVNIIILIQYSILYTL